MALRGAFRHPKMLDLAELLQVPRVTALGIMEQLWATTADFQPNGAIGRLSNRAIAAQLEWVGDPDKLVRALVDAKLLDELRSADRLYIHNWHKKNDNTVDAKLYRAGVRYANGAMPRGTKIGDAEKTKLYEKFYKQPATSLFTTEDEAAKVTAETQSAPSNVLQFVPAPCGAAKRLPEPEPAPAPEPVTPYPLAGKGGMKKQQRALEHLRKSTAGEHLHQASLHVTTALGVSGTYGVRLQTAVVMAMEAECKRIDKPPEIAAMDIAKRMVESRQDYLRCRHLLKFQWEPPKFFEGGFWADDRTWPWDQQRITQQQQASVGMR